MRTPRVSVYRGRQAEHRRLHNFDVGASAEVGLPFTDEVGEHMRSRTNPRGRCDWRLGALTLVSILVFALPAQAATPKAGCFAGLGDQKSQCNPLHYVATRPPPPNPVMTVSFGQYGPQINEITVWTRCLGTNPVRLPNGSVLTDHHFLEFGGTSVNRSGRFSFRGKASHGDFLNARVTLAGQFVTPTRARVTFTIHHGTCGTYNLKMHWDGIYS
jgi:hypothetical protein